MNDFGTDQFTVDTESIYPLFSDIQANRYTNKERRCGRDYTDATYSTMVKHRIQNLEAPCRCNKCTGGKIISGFVDNNSKSVHVQPAELMPQLMPQLMPRLIPLSTPPSQKQQIQHQSSQDPNMIIIDSNTLIIMFMFIIVVFVCSFGIRAMNNLSEQIKLLRAELKK